MNQIALTISFKSLFLHLLFAMKLKKSNDLILDLRFSCFYIFINIT